MLSWCWPCVFAYALPGLVLLAEFHDTISCLCVRYDSVIIIIMTWKKNVKMRRHAIKERANDNDQRDFTQESSWGT